MANRLISPRNRLILPRGYRKPDRPVVDPYHPLGRGLVGFWPLGDSGSGGIPDVSQSSANGSVASGPLGISAGPGGGLANTFNGSNAVTVPVLTAWTGMRACTVVLWIKGSTTASIPISMWGTNDGFGMYTDGLWYLGNGSAWTNATHGLLTDNAWHCYAVSYTGSQLISYRDGVVLSTVSASGLVFSSITNNQLNISGDNRSATDFYTGSISAVRIYNVGLSAAQIINLYAEPYAGVHAANAWIVGATATGSVGTIGLDIAVAGTDQSLAAATGTIGLNIAVAGVGQELAGSSGTIGLNIAIAGVGSSGGSAVGTIGLDIAVSGAGAELAGGAGAIGLDIAVAGSAPTTQSGAGSVGLDIAVAGVSGTGQIGGHFLPLTKKQLEKARKEARRIAKAREAEWTARAAETDQIAAEMQEILSGPSAQSIPPIEFTPADQPDPEDEEAVELLLLYG